MYVEVIAFAQGEQRWSSIFEHVSITIGRSRRSNEDPISDEHCEMCAHVQLNAQIYEVADAKR
jgi:hypothetical protein